MILILFRSSFERFVSICLNAKICKRVPQCKHKDVDISSQYCCWLRDGLRRVALLEWMCEMFSMDCMESEHLAGLVTVSVHPSRNPLMQL